jgi:hypothetical protein
MAASMKVVLRIRPLLKNDVNFSRKCVVSKINDNEVIVHDKSNEYKSSGVTYSFHNIFDSEASQHEVCMCCMESLVADICDGISSSVFAYGMTGAGKTHTMIGPDGGRISMYREFGCIAFAASEIFRRISCDCNSCPADEKVEFDVSVSFVEVYCGGVFDLLSPSTGQARVPLKVTNQKNVLMLSNAVAWVGG